MADKPTTKKYAKGERSIPHASEKASKYYPAEDVAVPKKVRTNDDNKVDAIDGSIVGGCSGCCALDFMMCIGHRCC
jgi:hypothetical protein